MNCEITFSICVDWMASALSDILSRSMQFVSKQQSSLEITFESEETDTNFALAIWSYLTDECKVRWASIDQDLNHESKHTLLYSLVDNDRVAFRLENMVTIVWSYLVEKSTKVQI